MSRFICLLILSVMASAIYLVKVRYDARELRAELARLESESAELNLRRRQLQIERAAFSDLDDVREFGESIGMRHPTLADGTLIFAAKESQ